MRTTVTINDTLFKALKQRALDTDQTVSNVIEDAVKYQVLEDLEDIEDAYQRADEINQPFAKLVGELKAEGLL